MAENRSCCGEKRDSPYCPKCGQCLRTHDLNDLLAHCQENLRLRRQEMVVQISRLRWLETPHTVDDTDPKHLEDREKARASCLKRQIQRVQLIEDQIAKWERWATGLQHLIQQQ